MNNISAAKRLAAKRWDTVQTQHKLADGIWQFETAGHGGIVVDTDIRPELSEWNEFVPIKIDSGVGRISEQHFAAFEEDCEAAIVEWIYAYNIWKPSFRRLFIKSGLADEEWYTKREEILKHILETYNPDILTKYPKIRKEKEDK